jgi:hypothetical protein
MKMISIDDLIKYCDIERTAYKANNCFAACTALRRLAEFAKEYAVEAEPDKGWISVKKGFPCYDEEVLVYTENGCTVGFCDCDGDWNLDLDIGAVTHWRPLPEKPKGE